MQGIHVMTDMRNKTLRLSKKIKLTFAIDLSVDETQFSKTTITKNDTFFNLS